MPSMDQRTKEMFRSLGANLATVMRARFASEHHARSKKIKTLKSTIKAIDAAVGQPGSKRTLQTLTVVRNQIAELLTQEVKELTKRRATSKQPLASFRSRSFPFGKG